MKVKIRNKPKCELIIKTSEEVKQSARKALRHFRKNRSDKNKYKYLKLKNKYITLRTEEQRFEKKRICEEIKAIFKCNDWGKKWQVIRKNVGKMQDSFQEMNKISSKIWVKHFDNIYNVKTNLKLQNEWFEFMQNNQSVPELDKTIDTQEIIQALRGMKGKSAPGRDGILTDIYKHIGHHHLE